MAGAGSDLASEGDFTLAEWAEVRDEKLLSSTWSIWQKQQLLTFDAVKRTLVIDRRALRAAGVTVSII